MGIFKQHNDRFLDAASLDAGDEAAIAFVRLFENRHARQVMDLCQGYVLRLRGSRGCAVVICHSDSSLMMYLLKIASHGEI